MLRLRLLAPIIGVRRLLRRLVERRVLVILHMSESGEAADLSLKHHLLRSSFKRPTALHACAGYFDLESDIQQGSALNRKCGQELPGKAEQVRPEFLSGLCRGAMLPALSPYKAQRSLGH